MRCKKREPTSTKWGTGTASTHKAQTARSLTAQPARYIPVTQVLRRGDPHLGQERTRRKHHTDDPTILALRLTLRLVEPFQGCAADQPAVRVQDGDYVVAGVAHLTELLLEEADVIGHGNVGVALAVREIEALCRVAEFPQEREEGGEGPLRGCQWDEAFLPCSVDDEE